MAPTSTDPFPSASAPAPTISVTNLSYTFPTTPPTPCLQNITFDLPARSRTILIGANGAGKTTLLRLLSGAKLCGSGKILVGGVDPFSGPVLDGVTYLGLEWALNPIVRRHDIGVAELLDSVGGRVWRDRRDQLVRVMDVDERWRMARLSDGERRRVQLCMGLLRPWVVLLLDEVTVDLDVLARSRLLAFLLAETHSRPCTIVYATHIMDGLSGWPTHLVHMALGSVKQFGTVEDLNLRGRLARGRKQRGELQEGEGEGEGEGEQEKGGLGPNSALLDLVLGWLEEDFREREGSRRPRVVGGIQ